MLSSLVAVEYACKHEAQPMYDRSSRKNLGEQLGVEIGNDFDDRAIAEKHCQAVRLVVLDSAVRYARALETQEHPITVRSDVDELDFEGSLEASVKRVEYVIDQSLLRSIHS